MKTVKVALLEDGKMPEYGSANAAGADIFASKEVFLMEGVPALVPTGIRMELPEGYEAQVRPRSGLALKGITVYNTPGTVDEDYRGEVGVILMSNANRTIEKGMKIAQLVIKKYEQFEFVAVDELSETARGANGFGSTGVK